MKAITWGYKGAFTLAEPATSSTIERHIVKDCECYYCKSNRQWLERTKLADMLREWSKKNL